LPPAPPLFPYTTLFRSGQPGSLMANRSWQKFMELLGGAIFLNDPQLLLYFIPIYQTRPIGKHFLYFGPATMGSHALRASKYQPRSEEHTSELQSRENLV